MNGAFLNKKFSPTMSRWKGWEEICICKCVCMHVSVYVHACVNKFFYKPGRAEAATDISSEFAYSWLNLHLAMQMYANIISEHFKNRNQHSKRHRAS